MRVRVLGIRNYIRHTLTRKPAVLPGFTQLRRRLLNIDFSAVVLYVAGHNIISVWVSFVFCLVFTGRRTNGHKTRFHHKRSTAVLRNGDASSAAFPASAAAAAAKLPFRSVCSSSPFPRKKLIKT